MQTVYIYCQDQRGLESQQRQEHWLKPYQTVRISPETMLATCMLTVARNLGKVS